MANHLVDHSGQQIGAVMVIRRGRSDGYGRTYWVCVCECDPEREFERRSDLLTRAGIASCGCKRSQLIAEAARKPDDEIGYMAAHDRVRTARGRADEHACSTCGNPAIDWALKKNARRQHAQTVGSDAGHPFSPDPNDYQAMCRSCHTRYDRKDHS